MWFKKTSYKDDLSGYGRHRANCYARLGNQHYVGDYSNGRIYKMSTNYYDDNGEEIQRILYSKEMETGMPEDVIPICADRGGIWGRDYWWDRPTDHVAILW